MGRERVAPTENPRICPKCGKVYIWGRKQCNAMVDNLRGNGKIRCETPTIAYVPDEPEPEVKAEPKKSKKKKTEK